MKYTTAFLNEVNRYHTVLGFEQVPRMAMSSTTIGGVGIAKGQLVSIGYRFAMMNEKYYKNADQFDYTRWLKNGGEQNQFSYIPFGGGPRNCIGQHLAQLEAKMILIEIFRHFRLSIRENMESRIFSKLLMSLENDEVIVLKNI